MLPKALHRVGTAAAPGPQEMERYTANWAATPDPEHARPTAPNGAAAALKAPNARASAAA